MAYTSVEQLLTDDGFLAWYRGSDKGQVACWTSWIIASEENAELARQAYDLLHALEEVEGEGMPEEDIPGVWAAIEARIRQERRDEPPPADT